MRVLITDDDASVRDALRKVLENAGYEVALATDGREAIAIIRTKAPDLLLLDMEMPKCDGWDVLEFINTRAIPTPVVVITGRSDQLHTRNIPGTHALLEKPADVELVLNKISELLKVTATGFANGEPRKAGCALRTAIESVHEVGQGKRKRTN